MNSKQPEVSRNSGRVIKKYPNRRLYDTDKFGLHHAGGSSSNW